MTRNVVRNLQAVLVLLGALVAWLFLPHELLRPVAFLESTGYSCQANVLSGLLTDLERQCLRLGTPIDAGHAIGVIRERQSLLTLAGTSLGIVGIGAGLIVLIAYSKNIAVLSTFPSKTLCLFAATGADVAR